MSAESDRAKAVEEYRKSQMSATPSANTMPGIAAPLRVTVVDVDISFGHMIVLIIKFVIAAIPAAIILAILFAVFGAVFAGLIGGLGRPI